LINTQGNTEIPRSNRFYANAWGYLQRNSRIAKKVELGITSGVEEASETNDGLFRKNGINKGFYHHAYQYAGEQSKRILPK
jgi:hypothetical protein